MAALYMIIRRTFLFQLQCLCRNNPKQRTLSQHGSQPGDKPLWGFGAWCFRLKQRAENKSIFRHVLKFR